MIARDGLDRLIRELALDYRVLGPSSRNGSIVFAEIGSLFELPIGMRLEDSPGRSQLVEGASGVVFGFAVGPESPKKWLYPSERVLFRARRVGPSFEVTRDPGDERPLAFVGARGCDLAAIAAQDRILIHGPLADERYAGRRASMFVVAVNCSRPSAMCFCGSMGTGPSVRSGFDLALTELLEPEHRFVVEVGTEKGASLLAKVSSASATSADLEARDSVERAASSALTRELDVAPLPEVFDRALESKRWSGLAARCMSCTNCTLVCPTCFCVTFEDTTDLTGTEATRHQRWDSCFSTTHSYLHGGSVRRSGAARYRQWMTHKLGTWSAQFGTSGCVGCGRCTTWCPAGIDFVEVAKSFVKDDEARRQG